MYHRHTVPPRHRDPHGTKLECVCASLAVGTGVPAARCVFCVQVQAAVQALVCLLCFQSCWGCTCTSGCCTPTSYHGRALTALKSAAFPCSLISAPGDGGAFMSSKIPVSRLKQCCEAPALLPALAMCCFSSWSQSSAGKVFAVYSKVSLPF